MPWDTPISQQTVAAAITIGRYLIEHGKIAFGMMGTLGTPIEARIADAHYTVRWIIDGGRATFHKRDLYSSERSRFPRAEDADPVIDLLIDRHIIRRLEEEPSKRGGRPAEKYVVNPQVFRGGYRVDGPADT
jgi:hypothetical protein